MRSLLHLTNLATAVILNERTVQHVMQTLEFLLSLRPLPEQEVKLTPSVAQRYHNSTGEGLGADIGATPTCE